MTNRCLTCGTGDWCEHQDGTRPSDGRRQRVLSLARADLVMLPDLVDELSRCTTERPPVNGGSTGKPGSRPPLRLEVLHLVDERRKPGWHGEDPRESRWSLTWGMKDDERHSRLFPTEDAATGALARLNQRDQDSATIEQWRARDVYGVLTLLESWTRIVCEEMDDPPYPTEPPSVQGECSALVEAWDWIEEQQWADELAEDVQQVAGRVRAALFVRKEPRYRCPECGERAYLVVGGFLTCANQHEQSVRDLELQYRRRPPAATRELAEEFNIAPERIRKWAERKQIKPVRTEGRAALYLPWDVFCLVNPDIRSALDERDSVKEGA